MPLLQLNKLINKLKTLLPMHKNSTQFQNVPQDVEAAKTVKHPKASTISFIKQFARAYKCTSPMLASLGGVVLN